MKKGQKLNRAPLGPNDTISIAKAAKELTISESEVETLLENKSLIEILPNFGSMRPINKILYRSVLALKEKKSQDRKNLDSEILDNGAVIEKFRDKIKKEKRKNNEEERDETLEIACKAMWALLEGPDKSFGFTNFLYLANNVPSNIDFEIQDIKILFGKLVAFLISELKISQIEFSLMPETYYQKLC
jgi:hypothetical protein